MIGTSPVNAPARSGKKKERHAHSPNQLMDDYFKEEEEKSRKVDNAPVKGSGVPPPPKTGGPPIGGPPKATTPKPEDGEE
jgi:hypothetical protein